MILTNRFLMEEEEEHREDKKEDNAPSFLNKKMEQIFFEKRFAPFSYSKKRVHYLL